MATISVTDVPTLLFKSVSGQNLDPSSVLIQIDAAESDTAVIAVGSVGDSAVTFSGNAAHDGLLVDFGEKISFDLNVSQELWAVAETGSVDVRVVYFGQR